MNLESYKFRTDNTGHTYEFESIGPKGVIRKVIKFIEIGDGVFNLGFGDLDEKTSKINDDVVTNNGDTEKVLATVAMAAYDFTTVFIGALIFIQGTTPVKTMLYQRKITRYWNEINKLFEVHGLINDKWEPFQKGVNYHAFLAWRHDGAFFI